MDITIQNPYQVPKLKELKETILDIKAVDKRNIHYIIEMQVFHTTTFEKKSSLLCRKILLSAIELGRRLPQIKPGDFPGFFEF